MPLKKRPKAPPADVRLQLVCEIGDVLACDGLTREDGAVQGIALAGDVSLRVPYGGKVFLVSVREMAADEGGLRFPVGTAEETETMARRIMG